MSDNAADRARSEPREPMTPDAEELRIDALLSAFQEASFLLAIAPPGHASLSASSKERAILRNMIRAELLAVAALRRQLDAARLGCAFFASAIKSGEPWTPDAQDLLDQVMGRAATVPSTGAGLETANG